MRDKLRAKTNFQMGRYLDKRRELNGNVNTQTEQNMLAGWLSSLAQAMDVDTLRAILMDFYSDTYIDMNALDVLSNPRILRIESDKPNGLKFKDRIE